MGVAKRHDPGIILHQKIQDRDLELWFGRTGAQFGQAGPGRAQEDRQKGVVGNHPGKGLKGKDLGGVLLHLASSRPEGPKSFLNDDDCAKTLKDFLTKCRAMLKRPGERRRRRKMSGRVLIVDDVASNRILYRARLEAAFYDPVLASDGQGCLAAVLAVPSAQRPDLILLDLNLPDIPGDEVLRQLRADPRGRDIPVIALTAAQDPAAWLSAYAAGADDVIVKPALDRLLMARVRNLMRSQAAFAGDAEASGLLVTGLAEAAIPYELPGTLAIISARPGGAVALRDALADHLRDRLVALSRTEVLTEAGAGTIASAADVFIVAAEPGDDGTTLRLLSELKSHQNTRHAAVCVVHPSTETEAAALALDLGADDVAGPAVSMSELALRLRSTLRRKRAADQHRARMQDGLRLALIDPLTGLYNRRYVGPKLASIAARALATNGLFAVMVIDLDRFKRVNDQHGHAAGDQVLVEVARRLRANLRDSDLLARIGGEEFLVVLPDSSLVEARQIAERLCASVEERPIALTSGLGLTVTVSIGVAVSGAVSVAESHRKAETVPCPGGCADAVVEAADLALLEAKGAGRNQVTFRRSAA
jgi:two-component system, cell cycle response regulator